MAGTTEDLSPAAVQAIQTAVREELERLHREMRDEAGRVGRGVAALFAAALVLYLGFVFLCLMAIYFLGNRMEPWRAAAIVGAAMAAGALVLLWQAKRYLDRAVRR